MKRRLPKPAKAYKDLAYLNSPDARIVRMLAEFLQPQARFRREGVRDTIVFFGSARVTARKQAIAELRRVEALIKGEKKTTSAGRRKLREAQRQVEMSRYYEEAVELARLLTAWSKSLDHSNRFVICSGGGPGIMEAANKGAYLARGKSIGMNISLPFEQFSNPYISRRLNFEFHYFFMRKFWFAYLAKALIVFPGGFGTLDELMEILTLLQTRKIKKKMAVVIYGSEYWKRVLNFDEIVSSGMVSKRDLKLFKVIDTPQAAFEFLKDSLMSNYPT